MKEKKHKLLGVEVEVVNTKGTFTCFVAQIDENIGITLKYLDLAAAKEVGYGMSNDGSAFCINFSRGKGQCNASPEERFKYVCNRIRKDKKFITKNYNKRFIDGGDRGSFHMTVCAFGG